MLIYTRTITLIALMSMSTAQLFSRDELAHQEWEAFKTLYGKTYDNLVEELYRKTIFLENRLKIALHNNDTTNTFRLKMNFFGDYLPEEISRVRTGLKLPKNFTLTDVPNFLFSINASLPDSLDWTELGYVTPVKDQGLCASSWAFAATGAYEGQMKRTSGKLVSFSEQNLIDCSKEFGNDGCEGGVPEYAFNYIRVNGGIDTEASYPYEAKMGTCRYSPENKIGILETVQFWNALEKIKVMAMLNVTGPVCVGMYAAQDTFDFYSEGIYSNGYRKCPSSTDDLNHAALLVGYGTENGQKYWKIKNSWGSRWGENGYLRLKMDGKTCGIPSLVILPTVL